MRNQWQGVCVTLDDSYIVKFHKLSRGKNYRKFVGKWSVRVTMRHRIKAVRGVLITESTSRADSVTPALSIVSATCHCTPDDSV